MKQIGQKLRSKRESLGMTLIDLEKKIKIQKKYIEMIEKNDFNRLPNPDYTRGFIEKYASAVNLNGSELIQQHESELPERKISAKEAIDNMKQSHVEEKDHTARKMIAIILSILAILFVIWLLSQFLIKDRDHAFKPASINPSRNVTVEKKEEVTPKKNVQKKSQQKQETKSTTNVVYKNFDGSNLSYEIKTDEPLQIKIDSKVPNWVQVFDNNKKNYAYKELKQETLNIDKDVKDVTIISGNSTSTDIYINKQKVTIPKEAENLITRTYYFKVVKN
ncbi:helix-turn-helix domain-containing protein [Macrococcus armenti]|uniref:Helix-turn-helix domain-containing protein n=1 Tax=Macrococcus armenti TaxID=2875764 RepID=A0ABY3ZWZ2_9STAP|nr:helix-turn-helix domain-containing protein [Macrococcus armenti]UOB21439.1 helix-turn-helix domain-containing protein [Macrococcus armenti]